MNPLAKKLNDIIIEANPYVFEALSFFGKNIFFPKSILKQSAEAKEQADTFFNATIGMATERGKTLFLPSMIKNFNDIDPEKIVNYTSSYGMPDLRQAWQDEIYKKTPSLTSKNISLPIVTNGITNGISIFSDMFIDKEDDILLPNQMWGNYNLIMGLKAEGCVSHFDMFSDGEFNLKAFKEAIGKIAENKSKIIIPLNFPNNPTGYNLKEKEQDEIVKILFDFAEKGLTIVTFSDDAYFGLNFGAGKNESLFGKLTDVHDRIVAVKVDGITKEAFAWGLRIGFITYGVKSKNHKELYNALEQKTAGDIRASISNVSTLSQTLALNVLKDENYSSEREAKVSIIEKRYRKILKVLKREEFSKAWEVYPCNAGYFVALKLKENIAEELRLILLKKYKVGIIAINDHDIRIAFSCIDEENIEELVAMIYKAFNDISK